MNIVFWSLDHVHAGCSTNALSMALWHALHIDDALDDRVSFIQTGFANYATDYAILGSQVLTENYFGTGMDNLLSIARSRALVYQDAYNSSFSLADKNLLYYIASRQTNRESFNQTLTKLPDLIAGLNEHVEFNYIDLTGGEDALSDGLLALTDILVINVLQNDLVLNQSIEKADSLIASGLCTKKQLRFCIGNYEPASTQSVKNLAKKYPLLRRRTFCIPRNIDLLDAMATGRMYEFFAKNSGSMERYKGITDQKEFFDTLQKNLDYFEKEE